LSPPSPAICLRPSLERHVQRDVPLVRERALAALERITSE
jgi:hypothetical protein